RVWWQNLEGSRTSVDRRSHIFISSKIRRTPKVKITPDRKAYFVRGRPQKPAVIKRLQGTFRKDRQNPDQPKPDPLKIAPAPEWLDQYGRECWEAHVPHLLNNRLLTSLGIYMFAAVCERWSTYRRAVDDLKNGLTHMTDSNGLCSRPEVAIAKQAFNDFRQGLQEFG